MDYYQDDGERARKIKIIAVATAAAVAVLAIGAWIIVAAISSTNTAQDEGNVAVEETTISEEKPEENKNTDKDSGKTTAKVPENKTTAPVVTEVDTKKTDLPTTGPADMLPFALLAGVMVAFMTSRSLAKASE